MGGEEPDSMENIFLLTYLPAPISPLRHEAASSPTLNPSPDTSPQHMQRGTEVAMQLVASSPAPLSACKLEEANCTRRACVKKHGDAPGSTNSVSSQPSRPTGHRAWAVFKGTESIAHQLPQLPALRASQTDFPICWTSPHWLGGAHHAQASAKPVVCGTQCRAVGQSRAELGQCLSVSAGARPTRPWTSAVTEAGVWRDEGEPTVLATAAAPPVGRRQASRPRGGDAGSLSSQAWKAPALLTAGEGKRLPLLVLPVQEKATSRESKYTIAATLCPEAANAPLLAEKPCPRRRSPPRKPSPPDTHPGPLLTLPPSRRRFWPLLSLKLCRPR
ncbi:hypothetical protein B0J12DRAFT_752062 [Macrophomina phaseolina]|uniref:Uncharacterized protein n=1 Tax=Macrophomina phaseolina TaxID=35725 RepID=A0ABQ8GDG3_9PEZI|nr:hypothetical protein B0J12DRAFT_752062 [Macrophomina phaseolina]